MSGFKLNFSKIQPKTPLYRGGGTGRDTYVMHDSGGFVKGAATSALMISGSQVRRFTMTSRPRTSRIEGKVLNYRSNGTGRDSYVVVDSGGLTSREVSPNAKGCFMGTLRSYQRIKGNTNLSQAPDFFEWAQRTRTGREAESEFNKSRVVTNLVERLAQPRRTYSNFIIKTPRQPGSTLNSLKRELDWVGGPMTPANLSAKNEIKLKLGGWTQRDSEEKQPTNDDPKVKRVAFSARGRRTVQINQEARPQTALTVHTALKLIKPNKEVGRALI